MPISPYLAGLRARIGHALVMQPGAAAVIKDEAGHILLGKIAGLEIWNLPAGHIDPGESPAQAVIREVAEETGLIVTPTRLLGVCGGLDFRHTYPNGDTVETTIVVLACRVDGGTLHPVDGELEELRYFPPDALPTLAVPYPRALFVEGHEPCF